MLSTMLDNVRRQALLVHSITNYVTANDCANIFLACGASPIMADEIDEVEEITKKSKALYINIGTLNQRTLKSMLVAGKCANQLKIPVVVDFVGAGISKFRLKSSLALLKNVQFAVIHGNMSEIKALSSEKNVGKGIDVDVKDIVTNENIDDGILLAKKIALKTKSVVVITGAVDIVTDGVSCYLVRNGDADMSKVTGTGCQLSAMIAAFVGANRDNNLEATLAAVCAMGLCGEQAKMRLTNKDGNSSYRNYIIDAVYRLIGEQLESGASYELR